jgi:glycine cleavage system aminomethyltransferase T
MRLAQSSLHELHRARGARIEARGGWLVPADYGSVEAELAAARSGVVVGERCGRHVLDLAGTEIPELAGRLGVAGVPVGAAAPVALAEADAARWYRLTHEHARLVADQVFGNQEEKASLGEGNGVLPAQRLAAALAARCAPRTAHCLHITDVSSGLTTLVVFGPRGEDLLARLARLDLDPRVFADRRLALTSAVGVPLQIVRWDRGLLLAYELTVGRDVAEYFCDALLHAGSDVGLQLIGTDAQAHLEEGATDEHR